jgi:hypothetical protein
MGISIGSRRAYVLEEILNGLASKEQPVSRVATPDRSAAKTDSAHSAAEAIAFTAVSAKVSVASQSSKRCVKA